MGGLSQPEWSPCTSRQVRERKEQRAKKERNPFLFRQSAFPRNSQVQRSHIARKWAQISAFCASILGNQTRTCEGYACQFTGKTIISPLVLKLWFEVIAFATVRHTMLALAPPSLLPSSFPLKYCKSLLPALSANTSKPAKSAYFLRTTAWAD